MCVCLSDFREETKNVLHRNRTVLSRYSLSRNINSGTEKTVFILSLNCLKDNEDSSTV